MCVENFNSSWLVPLALGKFVKKNQMPVQVHINEYFENHFYELLVAYFNKFGNISTILISNSRIHILEREKKVLIMQLKLQYGLMCVKK